MTAPVVFIICGYGILGSHSEMASLWELIRQSGFSSQVMLNTRSWREFAFCASLDVGRRRSARGRLHWITPATRTRSKPRNGSTRCDGVLEVEGPERAHFLLEQVIDGARRKGAPVPYSANDALPQHNPGREAAAASRRPRHRAPDPLGHPLERAGHRAAGQQGILRTRRPHRQLPVARRPSTTPASCISGTPPRTSHGGDLVYIQGHSLARHLRPRLPRRPPDRGAAAQLPPGGRRQGPVVLSASLADAGLLAVPDRLDGPRAR